MAGRAAASAVADYMEDANAQAEEETQDKEAAVPCEDCGEIDCFNPPPESTPDEIEEFKRQLKEQQDAINDIPSDQLVQNMENYEKLGRGAKDAADRARARDNWIKNKARKLLNEDPRMSAQAAQNAAKNELKTMDVIHTPDLSAGGSGRISTENGGMGPRSANRSIGSQWSKAGSNPDGKTRLEQLKEHAQKAKEKGERSNAELKICDEGGSTKPNSQPEGSSGSGQGQAGPSDVPMS
ncbi:hypothetical protein BLA27_20340 [Brucella cytisi]|uniref:Novel toxin 15 domain-containing protein n=3 Tax=Brucella cytisi TaxID=407152 RepID=A0A1J6HGU3_9HYPH|nr:hypothetical protein BLA27_20340 [Brucella cytisi]